MPSLYSRHPKEAVRQLLGGGDLLRSYATTSFLVGQLEDAGGAGGVLRSDIEGAVMSGV